MKDIKKIYNNNKKIVENFSYITLLQVFILLSPLIVYPYLTRVLGLDLYGWVLTAQVVASYCTLAVGFGFRTVSARHIAINKDNPNKIATIISSIFVISTILWVLSLLVYIVIIVAIPSYREHFLLFLFSYGATFQVLLFPQYYFQGVEKMKYITLINVIIQLVFILLIFVVVRSADDYLYVPLLHTVGYVIGGALALYFVFVKDGIRFYIPCKKDIIYYLKDATPVFLTDMITTIKDKFNYILIGQFVGMNQVVVYDIGSKLTSLSVQPTLIVNTVLLPRMSQAKNNKSFKTVGMIVLASLVIIVAILNIFLGSVVSFLTGMSDIELFPIRIYLLSPLFLGVSSYIATNFLVAKGYNKQLLYSIIVTTIVYLLFLTLFFFLYDLSSIYYFVYLTVLSYFAELVYRFIAMLKIAKANKVPMNI